ncbi:(d)CMP kinase [Flagellimonas allohymeniacidonis]|uniref:Cytidylate kinase n=1 Tax=Flagellimonas allohymeniacidonis TaxID=2517819 RepID=A0A4Q8QCY6_9FLAO|nr:(d)CMP kinase [Allomuricauda hymeniacidonis]TAI48302.1 (d)CMP kinase [Allomuricauda hymeniacidonis]
MRKIIIAIDGYSSTGKSTVAKKLANALGYVYVDTGAMYRAVTLFALEKGFVSDSLDAKSLIEALPNVELKFRPNKKLGKSEMFLNGKNVEKEIRTMRVSEQVSQVSAVKEVREKLVELQQAMGLDKGIVMDGRDIGTVVFPEAELKIFMTASARTRAHRRYKELLERGDEVSFEQVLKNVEGRDFIDSTRTVSPLKPAKDAITFDNSDMGVEEQFERIHSYAQRVIGEEN